MKTLWILVVVLGVGANSWARCEEDYIPPHDWNTLMEVRNWAAGEAFAQFAKYAGLEWDQEAYLRDSHVDARLLLGYSGRTGLSCLKIDVTTGYTSYLWVFENYYRKTQTVDSSELEETFTEKFLRLAEDAGMLKYLSYSKDWV